MAPQFGTSGLRGLAVELTIDLIRDYVRAFLGTCSIGNGLYVGRDLRESSPRIAEYVIQSAASFGVDVTDCGATPTPALAMAAQNGAAAAIMVTGSHIPKDRNGLKFYSASGEITKTEELAILGSLGRVSSQTSGTAVSEFNPGPSYINRYVTAFGGTCLVGKHIGVWSHSAVGRDWLIAMLRTMGARVTEIGRSETFIPVDTEAVSELDRKFFRATVQEFGLDALVSTDGDGDRPLITDETGEVVPGDVLGQITAQLLNASIVVTPISSNSGAELVGAFSKVIRTKIGSPHVIAAMAAQRGNVVGYEPNGGFILGFDAQAPAGPLPALRTRDSHLPIVAVLTAGTQGLAARVEVEPSRFTATGRLREISSPLAAEFIRDLATSRVSRNRFLNAIGLNEDHSIDLTDGIRMILETGRIIHIRGSGNAPELRLYVEAESRSDAVSLLRLGLLELELALAELLRSEHERE